MRQNCHKNIISRYVHISIIQEMALKTVYRASKEFIEWQKNINTFQFKFLLFYLYACYYHMDVTKINISQLLTSYIYILYVLIKWKRYSLPMSQQRIISILLKYNNNFHINLYLFYVDCTTCEQQNYLNWNRTQKWNIVVSLTDINIYYCLLLGCLFVMYVSFDPHNLFLQNVIYVLQISFKYLYFWWKLF